MGLIKLPVAQEHRKSKEPQKEKFTLEKLTAFIDYIKTIDRKNKVTLQQICSQIDIGESLFFEYLKKAKNSLDT